MALRHLRKLLDRALVIHVVEVLEGGRIQRIGRPERQFLLPQKQGAGQQDDRDHQAKKEWMAQWAESLNAVYPTQIRLSIARKLNKVCTVRVILALTNSFPLPSANRQVEEIIVVVQKPIWS
jgi:hypothetical protein